jgi:hypothetical protein
MKINEKFKLIEAISKIADHAQEHRYPAGFRI